MMPNIFSKHLIMTVLSVSKLRKDLLQLWPIKLFEMRVFRYIDRQMLTIVNAMCLLSKIIIFQLPLLKKIIALFVTHSPILQKNSNSSMTESSKYFIAEYLSSP